MQSFSSWRDEFIARMSREGMRLDTIRAILRASATLTRLAVVRCNGGWPGEDPDHRWATEECTRCGSAWHPSVLKRLGDEIKVCPDCRTAARLKALIETDAPGFTVVFQGDPRGCVVKIAKIDGRRGRDGEYLDTVGVPARS